MENVKKICIRWLILCVVFIFTAISTGSLMYMSSKDNDALLLICVMSSIFGICFVDIIRTTLKNFTNLYKLEEYPDE